MFFKKICLYSGAKKSLRFFRGKEYNITEEFDEISIKHESKLQSFTKLSWKFKMQRIFSRAFFKPFSCVGILNALSSWTGASIFEIYMIDTLTESGASIWINPAIVPTIVGINGLVTAGKNTFKVNCKSMHSPTRRFEKTF